MARCPRVKVRVDSIRVHKSESYGFISEPGASAEWRLTITANDQSRAWIHDNVRDNADYSLGLDFMIELPNDNATLTIRASGFEEDDTSANDPIPVGEMTHGSHDNRSIGQSTNISASSADFSYTLYYTITFLKQPVFSLVPRSQALDAVRARRALMGAEARIPDDQLLATFINKISGRGLQLGQSTPDLLTWTGPVSVHEVMSQAFPARTPDR